MQVCCKQYKSIAELEEHLSSYDHHHRKRLQEMKQMELERTRDSRSKKESKRQAKEQARLEKQYDPSCSRTQLVHFVVHGTHHAKYGNVFVFWFSAVLFSQVTLATSYLVTGFCGDMIFFD